MSRWTAYRVTSKCTSSGCRICRRRQSLTTRSLRGRFTRFKRSMSKMLGMQIVDANSLKASLLHQFSKYMILAAKWLTCRRVKKHRMRTWHLEIPLPRKEEWVTTCWATRSLRAIQWTTSKVVTMSAMQTTKHRSYSFRKVESCKTMTRSWRY